MKGKMKKLTIRIEKETQIALKRLAALREVSMSKVVEDAIKNVLAMAEDSISKK